MATARELPSPSDFLPLPALHLPNYQNAFPQNGLRLEVMFPSCWDGKNVDSASHQSHIAYPAGGESGPCPDTHPVRIVTLFYEVSTSYGY